MGTLSFNQIGSLYINPDNISPETPYSSDNTEEKYFSPEASKIPLTTLANFKLNK